LERLGEGAAQGGMVVEYYERLTASAAAEALRFLDQFVAGLDPGELAHQKSQKRTADALPLLCSTASCAFSESGFLMRARQRTLAGAMETNACSSSENDGNMEI